MEKDFSDDEKRLKVIFKDLPGMVDLWDEANKMKNRGFYVDYTTSLETPMQVTYEEYLEALTITDEFRVQIMEIFFILREFNRRAKKRNC